MVRYNVLTMIFQTFHPSSLNQSNVLTSVIVRCLGLCGGDCVLCGLLGRLPTAPPGGSLLLEGTAEVLDVAERVEQQRRQLLRLLNWEDEEQCSQVLQHTASVNTDVSKHRFKKIYIYIYIIIIKWRCQHTASVNTSVNINMSECQHIDVGVNTQQVSTLVCWHRHLCVNTSVNIEVSECQHTASVNTSVDTEVSEFQHTDVGINTCQCQHTCQYIDVSVNIHVNTEVGVNSGVNTVVRASPQVKCSHSVSCECLNKTSSESTHPIHPVHQFVDVTIGRDILHGWPVSSNGRHQTLH